MDEWLDIYDEHQRPTGRLRRRGDPIEPGDRYLVVTVFVRDSGGRFLTTRRSPQKAYYPGCWEVTSGTAQAKEDGLAAAVRELAEETGLAPDPAAFHYLGRLEHPTDGQGGIFILDHFLVQLPSAAPAIRMQPEEVADWRWRTPDEVEQLCRTTPMEPLTPFGWQAFRAILHPGPPATSEPNRSGGSYG